MEIIATSVTSTKAWEEEEGNNAKRPKCWKEKDNDEALATKDVPGDNGKTKRGCGRSAISANEQRRPSQHPGKPIGYWIGDLPAI